MSRPRSTCQFPRMRHRDPSRWYGIARCTDRFKDAGVVSEWAYLAHPVACDCPTCWSHQARCAHCRSGATLTPNPARTRQTYCPHAMSWRDH